VRVLADAFDELDLPDHLVTWDRTLPADLRGGFLALETPHAARLRGALAERGVSTDSRGRYLRFGPAPYLTDDQLRAAMAELGNVARSLPVVGTARS
jgi:kynureninase